MALRDEIKAGRKDLMENGTLKQKIAYFFDYYTLHTVIIAAVIILATTFIYQQATKPDVVLNGLLLNVFSFDEGDPVEDLKNGFMDYIDMNTKEYDMSLNTSLMLGLGDDSGQSQMNDYQASQAMMVQCSAGAIDFISSPLNAIFDYGYGDMLANFETVLSKEELEKYELYFLYVDAAVVKQKAEAFDNNIDANEIPCPDPTKPEEMKEPIPVFIDVTKCEKIADIYDYSEETIVVSVAVNAPNPDRISDLLAYLFE